VVAGVIVLPHSFEDYGDGAPYWMGTASTIQHDDEPRDVVAELRKVVEEVTGKPVSRPDKPRMGFL